jgi:tetratricopeptide (TPR) repeat protein
MRRWATYLAGGLTVLPGGGWFGWPLHAAELSAPEQSIVVAERVLAPDSEEFAIASDLGDGEILEPIAVASEYEPDLAEPEPAGESPEPALAPDPAVDPSLVEGPQAGSDASESGEPSLGTAAFEGITPGESTRDDVLTDWGMPVKGGATSSQLIYELKGFPRVTVHLTGDQIELLQVELDKTFLASDLVQRLGLGELRTVSELNPQGNQVATVFPERGLAFIHKASEDVAVVSDEHSSEALSDPTVVCSVEIHPLRADDFVARARQAPERAYTQRTADLETALQLNPRSGEVRYLLSQAKLVQGAAVVAERLAAESVELAPRNEAYRLHWARCLTVAARYDLAVEQTRAVLEGAETAPLVRAQALHQMGNLAALGSREIATRAIPLQNKAIELADQLAIDGDEATRLAAKRCLLEAHLAVADQISRGEFQRKDEFVAQWMARASALAEAMITSGEADEALRLRVANTALAAGGRLQPPIDPEPWVDEAEEAVTRLRQRIDDELASAEIDWQLGQVYCSATEIQHRRGEADLAIHYGDVADALLSPLADQRSELPDTGYLLGRLYFQVGAVYAVHREDHREACNWYDRAVDRLLIPVPFTTLATPGQHGDALVSMGVSYWHLGRRDRAYELTRAGAQLVQQGVAEGLLAEDALQVAQGNLAAMGQALGRGETLDPISGPTPKTELAKADLPGEAGGDATPRSAPRRTAARRPATIRR